MRDGVVVENIYCTCRGSRFSSQHPYAGPQPFIVPIPDDPTSTSDFCRHQRCKQNIYTPTVTDKQIKKKAIKTNCSLIKKKKQVEGTSRVQKLLRTGLV